MLVHEGDLFPDLVHNSHLLPVGAELSCGSPNNDRYRLRKQAPDSFSYHYLNRTEQEFADPYYMHNQVYLVNSDPIEIPALTVKQYLWRLRDAALSAAERSGVRLSPVNRLVQEIGAISPLFTIGQVVASRREALELPDDSVIQAGDPSRPKFFDVQVMQDSQLVHALGRGNLLSTQYPVRIIDIPREHDLGEPATEQELARIAIRAYRIGMRYKRNESWCSVFENTLASFGVTPETLQAKYGLPAHCPGEEVNREDAGLMPEGSLFYWASSTDPSVFTFFRRDDSRRGAARTARVFGFNDDSSRGSRERMRLVSTPDDPDLYLHIPGGHLAQMPAGTTYAHPGNPDTTITLDEESRGNIRIWHTYLLKGVTF